MKTIPNPIDVHVGGKVKMYRLLAGISQKQLGEFIGVTFQQVQKYENGVNRIGASRLQQIAIALNSPLASFFDSTATTESSRSEADELKSFLAEFLATADGIRFFRAFQQVANLTTRASIIDLVVALAASSNERLSDQKAQTVRSAA